MKDTLTVQEAAEILKVTPRTIYNYCNDGLLGFYRFGSNGRVLIIKESLEEFIRRSEQKAGFTNKNFTLNEEKEI